VSEVLPHSRNISAIYVAVKPERMQAGQLKATSTALGRERGRPRKSLKGGRRLSV